MQGHKTKVALLVRKILITFQKDAGALLKKQYIF